MSNKQIIKVVEKVIALLTGPHWIQGYFAVDADGEPVSTRSRKAVKFCSMGALRRVSRNEEITNTIIDEFNRNIDADFYLASMVTFNDNNKKGKVMKVWRKTLNSFKAMEEA